MDFIEENETEDFADSGDASQTIPAVGIVHFGLFDDIEFKVIEELVVEVEQLKIDLNALADGRIGEVLGNTSRFAL